MTKIVIIAAHMKLKGPAATATSIDIVATISACAPGHFEAAVSVTLPRMIRDNACDFALVVDLTSCASRLLTKVLPFAVPSSSASSVSKCLNDFWACSTIFSLIRPGSDGPSSICISSTSLSSNHCVAAFMDKKSSSSSGAPLSRRCCSNASAEGSSSPTQLLKWISLLHLVVPILWRCNFSSSLFTSSFHSLRQRRFLKTLLCHWVCTERTRFR